MNEPLTPMEWADQLERIASAIGETVYSHDLEMRKYRRDRKVRYDDADHLRALAKQLRGEDGQLAHALGRDTLPWSRP